MSAFGFFTTGTRTHTYIHIYIRVNTYTQHTHKEEEREIHWRTCHLKGIYRIISILEKLPLCKSYNKLSGKVTIQIYEVQDCGRVSSHQLCKQQSLCICWKTVLQITTFPDVQAILQFDLVTGLDGLTSRKDNSGDKWSTGIHSFIIHCLCKY